MRRPNLVQGLVVVLACIVIAVLPLMQEAGGGLLPQQFIRKHQVLFWIGLCVLSTVAVILYLVESGRRGVAAEALPKGSLMWRTMTRLAEAVDDQWREEAGRRKIGDTDQLLAVRWSMTRPGLADDDATADAAAGHRSHTRPRLRDADEAAAAYLTLKSPHMVILGDAGSGKTALLVLLTRGLVGRWRRCPWAADEQAARHSGGADPAPVPVLLSLATWDPRKVGLRRWLADQLAENYPFLRNREVYGKQAPARLVKGVPKVLPLLDGLDELKPASRVRAIQEIERAGLPALIVTCRRSDYEQVMREGGSTIAAAATLTIEAIDSDAVSLNFIGHGYAPDQGRRWSPVLQRIREDPDGPPARALSTPLMVSLARDVYRSPVADPRELIDTTAFPTEESIQAHLLRALVPATFPDLPEDERRDDWDGPDVKRWLHFLAVSLGTGRSIRWWELARFAKTPERILAVVTGTVIMSPALALGFGALYGPVGAAIAAGIGALAACLAGTTPLPPPSELHFGGIQNLWPPVLSGLVAGIFVTITIGIRSGGGTGLLSGLVIGVPVGITYALAKPDATVQSAKPRQLLRWDIQVAVVFGLLYSITSGVVTGIVVQPVYGLFFGLSCGLCGAFLYGPVWLLAFRVNKVGLIAWLHFLLARVVLVPRGRLPWRTLAFLEEAHRRGVLRQTGPVYEFRHSQLQDVLAGRWVL